MEAGTSPIRAGSSDGGGSVRGDIFRRHSVNSGENNMNDNKDNDSNTEWSEQFRLIARRMSRALLRNPHPDVQTDKRVMYGVLYELFEQWSERQQRAHSVSLTVEQVGSILRYGEQTLRQASLTAPALNKAQVVVDLIAASPLITIGALTQELRGLQPPVVLTPMAEVLELARLLDVSQGVRTPVGAVNLVHFIALSSTLCPAPDMGALLLLVASNVKRCHLLCAAIYYEWAMIDAQNREGLLLLSRELEEKHQQMCEGFTVDILTPLLTGSFEPFGARPTDPVAVDYLGMGSLPCTGTAEEQQRCHQLAPPSGNELEPTCEDSDTGGHGEGDCESSVEDEYDSDCRDTVDTEFWLRLSS
ncbi:hypothetical protein, conserved [Trypanosoma brucei brucei TREU927]|uniref:Uncharacterized protein n=1 Tax=Trypanosoma brucei brucei (strain 927/4 GUTat10.1) TaxID=185431 RepID=Q57XF4_TRYB2|nr:hypothetical protein, conserved [Trypanosoma brucei brucei TREU927]AAX69737.1 hypothetical protein, conserved [Trypanosoma brucei]AAZ13002.1 hypothetical protein, conserved [Trypanosoma brucei brucei TREU927]